MQQRTTIAQCGLRFRPPEACMPSAVWPSRLCAKQPPPDGLGPLFCTLYGHHTHRGVAVPIGTRSTCIICFTPLCTGDRTAPHSHSWRPRVADAKVIHLRPLHRVYMYCVTRQLMTRVHGRKPHNHNVMYMHRCECHVACGLPVFLSYSFSSSPYLLVGSVDEGSVLTCMRCCEPVTDTGTDTDTDTS